MEWYDRIKSRRIEINISQQELAKRVGYHSRSSINKIEQGINDIPQSKIKDFAKALNVSPAWLLGYEDNSNNSNTDITNLYNQLDTEDKAEIRGEIKQMLKADKYTAAETGSPNSISDELRPLFK